MAHPHFNALLHGFKITLTRLGQIFIYLFIIYYLFRKAHCSAETALHKNS